MNESQTIECSQCGVLFIWNTKEQAFYAQRSLKAPRRCKGCRQTRAEAIRELARAAKACGGQLGDVKIDLGYSVHAVGLIKAVNGASYISPQCCDVEHWTCSLEGVTISASASVPEEVQS